MQPASNQSHRRRFDFRGWIMVAWVIWWSVAYVQGALTERFPTYLGWTRWPW